MMESRYWKEDLLRHAKKLKPIKDPPRWSERLVVNFEKDLIVSFFKIRKLFEQNKVSQKSRSYKTKIFCYEPTGKKITKLNQHFIDEIYNLEIEKETEKGIIFIANQLIHSCTVFAHRKNGKDRNWDGIFACSDWERNKTIYRIPILEIIKIFQLVGNNYISRMRTTYDAKKGDWKIETD